MSELQLGVLNRKISNLLLKEQVLFYSDFYEFIYLAYFIVPVAHVCCIK